MEVVAIKLTSGEEVVAELVESLTGPSYRRPRVIQMMQTQQGMGAGLVPYLMSASEDTITINPNCIVTTVKVDHQVERAYIQQTSGLDLATKF